MNSTLKAFRDSAHRRVTAKLRMYAKTRRAAMVALKENDIKTALYFISYIDINLKPALKTAREEAEYIDRRL